MKRLPQAKKPSLRKGGDILCIEWNADIVLCTHFHTFARTRSSGVRLVRRCA